MTDKQRIGEGSESGHGGSPFDGLGETAMSAFALAEAQARREALLARAERRRRRQEGQSATLLTFPLASCLRPRFALGLGPRPETCQWLYGDGPFADADKCGAPTQAGQSYCRAHLPRLFLEPEPEDSPDESAQARR